MLRIMEDLPALRDEIGDGVVDHRHVLFQGGCGDFRYVEGRGLPHSVYTGMSLSGGS